MQVTASVRVRYAETDQMGIVYYANYLVWFEIGRVELLRSLGLAYSQMESEERCILPVVECNCRYRAPARYDDEVLIEARPTLMRNSVIKFGYRILRKEPGGAEPTLLAEGETAHVVCDEQLNKIDMPSRYASALKAIIQRA
jgi:acyl-CoA thioester hydrolase